MRQELDVGSHKFRRKKRTVSLTDGEAQIASNIGDGNMAVGLRLALVYYIENEVVRHAENK